MKKLAFKFSIILKINAFKKKKKLLKKNSMQLNFLSQSIQLILSYLRELLSYSYNGTFFGINFFLSKSFKFPELHFQQIKREYKSFFLHIIMFSTYYIISYIFFYESKFTLCIIQFHPNYYGIKKTIL